jgi:catechol 2,3-dioxygenase-like lactoylglutathione lyase family enzyme
VEINLVGIALMVDDPAASAQWFVDHFGFTVKTDIGWYVNTRHESHANLSLDFVQRDHASSPDVLRGKRVAGTLLAFLVDDVSTPRSGDSARPAWTSSSPSPPRAGANAASR